MSKPSCQTCGKKTTRHCGICEQPSCQMCSHALKAGYFQFLENVPDELTHNYYCHNCFATHVEPTYQNYHQVLEEAQEMTVYFKKNHTKETRLFKRSKKRIKLTDQTDYDNMILHMAFLAAQDGHNCIIDVETDSRKIHNGSYKTVLWSGEAVPATNPRLKA